MAADADYGRGWKRVCFVRSRRRSARVLPSGTPLGRQSQASDARFHYFKAHPAHRVQPQGTVNTGLLSVVLSVNHGLVQLYRSSLGPPYLCLSVLHDGGRRTQVSIMGAAVTRPDARPFPLGHHAVGSVPATIGQRMFVSTAIGICVAKDLGGRLLISIANLVEHAAYYTSPCKSPGRGTSMRRYTASTERLAPMLASSAVSPGPYS